MTSVEQGEKLFNVLLDANIWIKEWMLTSFAGASLVDVLDRSGGKILLPGVVEEEILPGVWKLVQSASDKASDAIGLLNKLRAGNEYRFEPPSKDIVEKFTKDKLSLLGKYIINNPFTHEHSTKALKRIIEKRLPCETNNEQFRDCCIWEDCLKFGLTSKVYLVSGDKIFFKDRKLDNGPAPELLAEAAETGADIRIFKSVGDLFDFLAPSAPPRDVQPIALAIASGLTGSVMDAMEKHNFLGVKLEDAQVSLKETKSPVKQFGKFKLEFLLTGAADDDQRLNPKLTLEGNCSFDVVRSEPHDIDLQSETISWTTPEGEPIRKTDYHLRAQSGAYASTAISFG